MHCRQLLIKKDLSSSQECNVTDDPQNVCVHMHQRKRKNKKRLFIIITISNPVIVFFLCILTWSYFIVPCKPQTNFLACVEMYLKKGRFKAVNNYMQLWEMASVWDMGV